MKKSREKMKETRENIKKFQCREKLAKSAEKMTLCADFAGLDLCGGRTGAILISIAVC